MESQPQNPEFRNNPKKITHEYCNSFIGLGKQTFSVKIKIQAGPCH